MENIRVISASVPPVCRMADVYKMVTLPEFIKIKIHNERVWCKLTDVQYQLVVDNNMIDGYRVAGDIIEVSPNTPVLDIWRY